VVDTAVGRIGPRLLGALQSARPLRLDGRSMKEIHVAQFPGSMVGPIFADQIE